MRHVFYVHSPLTERISLSIARDIGANDPIYVTDKRHSLGSKQEVRIGDIYEFEKSKYNIFKRWYEISKGDKRVEELVGGDNFHVYVPQTTLDKIRILISHKSCSGYSIVEEGLTSYLTPKKINKMVPPKKEPIARQIKYLGRLGEKRFFREEYETIYALSEKSFPNYERVKVVNVNLGEESYAKKINKGDCILLTDSIRHYSKKASCSYVYSLGEVLKYLNIKYDKVHYKIHPDSYDKWQENMFRNMIRWGTSEATEIGRSAFTDDIAIGAGVDVIVNLSATGLYCGLFSEGDAYSFYNLFESSVSKEGQVGESDISDELDWVPEIYWENVQPLELT